jgi:hypothetical protein
MKKTTRTSLTQKAMQALTEAVAKVVEDHRQPRQAARRLAKWRSRLDARGNRRRLA